MHKELNNVWDTVYGTKLNNALPGVAITITYEEYKQKLKDQTDLVDLDSKNAQGAHNLEFQQSLNVNITPTTNIHQTIINDSVPPTDPNNYLDGTELLGHDLETGELWAFKALSNRR